MPLGLPSVIVKYSKALSHEKANEVIPVGIVPEGGVNENLIELFSGFSRFTWTMLPKISTKYKLPL